MTGARQFPERLQAARRLRLAARIVKPKPLTQVSRQACATFAPARYDCLHLSKCCRLTQPTLYLALRFHAATLLPRNELVQQDLWGSGRAS
ncbi:MAG: hypothetical protein WBM84_04580, partial [Sedimenticolaceae bacterium]